MVFSERVGLTLAHGIRFRTGSLRSVAIYDNCQCWGLWSPMQPDKVRSASGTASLGAYHLTISPFHPVSWPFLLRIQLRLNDRAGTLEAVAEQLRSFSIREELREYYLKPREKAERKERYGFDALPDKSVLPDGLNIVHQDQAPTGFGHSSWTLVAEAVAVRARYQDLKAKLDERFVEPRIRSKEKTSNSGYKTGYLLHRVIRREMELVEHKLRRLFETWRQETSLLRNFRKSRQNEAPLYRVRRLYDLPYHSMFGGGSGAPFGMRYDSHARELRFAQPIDYPGANQIRQVLPVKRPHLAIATFDPAEYMLRLVPIPEHDRKYRSLLLEVEYDIRSRGASKPGLSRGLVARVAEIAKDQGFSILSIINKLRETSLREERGSLRILILRSEPMESPKDVRHELAKQIKRLADKWEKAGPGGGEKGSQSKEDVPRSLYVEISARCTTPAVHQLFISMNFGHPRRKNIEKLLRRACAECGFQPVVAESYSDTATEMVLKKIRACDGFLQILVEPKENQARRRSWLDFEYGLASGFGQPRMRLVDTSVRSYEKWNEVVDIDRDRYSRPIDLTHSDKRLSRELKKAIREIGGRIAQR